MRDDLIAALRTLTPGPQPGTLRAEFRFDPALPTFRGHFPGKPLLPGVFHVEMVRLAVERLLARPCSVAQVTRAKFLRAVVPGELLCLEARIEQEAEWVRVHATVTVDSAPAASLSMVLAITKPTPA